MLVLVLFIVDDYIGNFRLLSTILSNFFFVFVCKLSTGDSQDEEDVAKPLTVCLVNYSLML